MPRPPWMLPEVGTLFQPNADAVLGSLPPTWTQPGGPGTRVFPQQTDSAAGEFEPPMTPTGMYVPGCGHPCNCLAVFKQYDIITAEDVAIICCPACTYIQQIINPYRNYENYIKTPIFVG